METPFGEYDPKPLDTSDVVLPPEMALLREQIAEQVHDIWAQGRVKEGWTYGSARDAEAPRQAGVDGHTSGVVEMLCPPTRIWYRGMVESHVRINSRGGSSPPADTRGSDVSCDDYRIRSETDNQAPKPTRRCRTRSWELVGSVDRPESSGVAPSTTHD